MPLAQYFVILKKVIWEPEFKPQPTKKKSYFGGSDGFMTKTEWKFSVSHTILSKA
jgi:hypothetical protein